jgi:hypothetical protein
VHCRLPRRLVALLAIALILRLAAGWVWQSRLSDHFAMGDSESYWQLGRAIAHSQPYQYEGYRVFRTPGYPVLLAPVFRLAGDGKAAILLARAEAALFGTLAVLAAWWLTRLLFNDRAAWIAAILATFYPGAVVLSVLVLSEAPFCPLLLLHLGLWTAAWKARSPRRRATLSLVAGLTAGAATLMRPDWLLFTPLALFVGAIVGRASAGNSRRRTAAGVTPNVETALPLAASAETSRAVSRRLLAAGRSGDCLIAFWMLLGLILMMLPWWIRNAAITGRFVPATLQVGASLYDGVNPKADGSSNMDFVPAFRRNQRALDENAVANGVGTTSSLSRSFEWRFDRSVRQEALLWACNNPRRVGELAGIKFLRMWNFWPNERQFSAWPIRFAVFFTYTPLLIFAIIGIGRTLRRGWPYILCWLPAVYFTLLHMIFVSSIRYREPAMLALLALAAGAIVETFGRSERRS